MKDEVSASISQKKNVSKLEVNKFQRIVTTHPLMQPCSVKQEELIRRLDQACKSCSNEQVRGQIQRLKGDAVVEHFHELFENVFTLNTLIICLMCVSLFASFDSPF